MSVHDVYRRCDGALLSAVDLSQCVLIHPTELREWAWPIALVEDWLLHASGDVLAEFAHFLGSASCGATPADVAEHLGHTALALRRLIGADDSES